MPEPIRIMIIENEEDYAESLRDRAAFKNKELIHYENLEDGLSEIYDNFSSYDGLILDGKGYLNADNKYEKDVHAFLAVKRLAEFDKEGKIIPRIINTGYFKDMQDLKELDDIAIYEKFTEEDKMLDDLKELIHNSDLYKYRKKYPKIFSLFRNEYFPQRKELELVQILNALNSQEQSEIKANLALARTFLEPYYEAIQKAGYLTGNVFIPEEFIVNGKVKLFWCEIYVSGRGVKKNMNDKEYTWEPSSELVDNHIQRELNFIRTSCNRAGSHDYNKRFSNLTLQAVTYALLDILEWYHLWLDSLES